MFLARPDFKKLVMLGFSPRAFVARVKNRQSVLSVLGDAVLWVTVTCTLSYLDNLQLESKLQGSAANGW